VQNLKLHNIRFIARYAAIGFDQRLTRSMDGAKLFAKDIDAVARCTVDLCGNTRKSNGSFRHMSASIARSKMTEL
jgi:hypothetical protein